MAEKKMNGKKTLIAAVIVVIVAVLMFAGWYFTRQKPVEGQKDITVTVVYKDESSDKFEITTQAEFLRQALEEKDLVKGDESEYGLFITEVNGVKVDADNQEWWCITKSGETVNTGVDTTPIADGDSFEITLTVGY